MTLEEEERDETALFNKIQKVLSFYKEALPLCDGRNFRASMHYKTTCGTNERAIVQIEMGTEHENGMCYANLIVASAASFEKAIDKIIKMLPMRDNATK